MRTRETATREVVPEPAAALSRRVRRAAASAYGRAPPSHGLLGDELSQALQDVLRTPGSPLQPPVREAMEERFDADFSKVRLHTDAAAAASADAVDAVAYTVGNHVVLGAGSDGGATPSRLLAHELAHVLQQGQDGTAVPGELALDDPAGPAEREASAAADTLEADRTPALRRTESTVARQTAVAARTRTVVERFATAGREAGPVWDVVMTVTGVPQEQADAYDNFLYACIDGIEDAAQSLGAGAEAKTRTMRFTVRYRSRDLGEAQSEAFEKARRSVLGAPAPVTSIAFEETEAEPIVVEAPEPAPAPAPAKARLRESPADLIDRHTHGWNLREEELAADLRARVVEDAELVTAVLRRLDSSDRDDVAVALLEGATDEQIVMFGGDANGRRVLAVLLGELSSGVRTDDEEAQQRRVLELVPGDPIPAEPDAPEAAVATERPDRIVATHLGIGNLREHELARDLLGRLAAGRGPLVGRVLDALSSEDRDDVATHLLELADDAQLQAIARDASGRALLLRLVREMHSGVTTDDETRQMQRAMQLVTAADREPAADGQASGPPVEVEVLTFLYGSSALDFVGLLLGGLRGHTAITVGGLTYSFEFGWSCGRPRSEYMLNNQWRDAVGQVLAIPEADARIIQDRLNASCGTGSYAVSGDICTDSSARALESVLTTLGPGGWNPGAFVNRLEATGKVGSHRFFPRRPHEAPPQGSEGTVQRSRLGTIAREESWQDAGASRARATGALDVERLMRDRPDVVVNEILVSVFLAISREELATVVGTTSKYAPNKTLEIAYSGRDSKVPYHCTDLVMNSAWLAGFETPTGPGGFWQKSTRTLERVQRGRDALVAQVPVPSDDPKTPQDERKQHIRPGDVMVWGATATGTYGHQMIVIEPGTTGGKVVVREAGAAVAEGRERELDPSGRDEAVYRFLEFDAVRVSQSYTRNPAYRQRFHAAFEASSLTPDGKERYRR